jgi:hypothetical protein
MSCQTLHRVTASFVEGNGFLRAALGLQSLLTAFDRLLERVPSPEELAPGERDDVLFALLGAVALKRELEAILNAAGEENTEAFPTAEAQPAAEAGQTGWMR